MQSKPTNGAKPGWHVFLWIPVGICAVVGLLFIIGVLPPGANSPGAGERAAGTPTPAAEALAPVTPAPATPAQTATPAFPGVAEEPEAPAQPAGKPLGRRQTRYEIAGELSDSFRRITAVMRVEYTNTTGDELYELVFHLPANAYYRGDSRGAGNEERSYINGLQKGGVIISSVGLNGTLAYHTLSDDSMRLHVPFIKELAPDETAEALIEFVLDIPEKNGRYGRSALGYQLGNCWPILAAYQDGGWVLGGYEPWGDPYYSETADYVCSLRYPEGYEMACTGEIVSQEIPAAGQRKTTVAGSSLREFACMLTTGMRSGEATAAGVQLIAHALSSESVQKCLTHAQQALAAFLPYLGEHPYKTLTIAQAELYNASGMEYPGMIFIQRELFLPGNEQQLAFTIYHEVAHQWFYALVGNDQINAPWIDEAFAAYFGFLPLQQRDAAAYAALRRHYLEERAAEGGRIDGGIIDYKNEYDYADSVYWRGAAMLEELREEIGDEAFFSAVQAYLRQNAYMVATRADIVAAFSQAAGRPLGEWFDLRLAAPETPAAAEEETAALQEAA